MTRDPFAVAWPAPGFPALLEAADTHLELIALARDGDASAIERWTRQIALVDRRANLRIPLIPEIVRHAPAAAVEEFAGDFAALPSARGASFLQVRARIPALPGPDGPRSVRLLDLAVDGVVDRPHSVAIFGSRSRTLNLAFATDLHLAAIWNDVAAAVERWAPDLAGVLLHPQRNVECFIAETNALAARGDLDLVVLGGDLVDHRHTRSRADSAAGDRATNIDRLLDAVARIEVPTLLVPGNHDYRAYPRRLRSSGLADVGIPLDRARRVLRRAGWWDRWPVRWSDKDHLSVRDTAGKPALTEYLTRVAPTTDYRCQVRGLRLLCASTGCDILAKWHRLEPARWGLLLRALPTSRDRPDSEGFTDAQLGRIRAWLHGPQGTALFFHAPLLSPPEGAPSGAVLTQLRRRKNDTRAERIAFERQASRAGLREGVSFRNPGVLIHDLVGAEPASVVAFSGHLHRPSALEVDRRTLCVRQLAVEQAVSRPETLTLLTAPAIGQSTPGDRHPPGYLLARFVDGSLVSLRRHTLVPVS